MTINGVRVGPLHQVPVSLPDASASGHAQADTPVWPSNRWRDLRAALPLRVALLATAIVWVLGCVWSFREQTLFAYAKGFGIPWLLPAVIDGLAIALACVAYAASLDARSGVLARLGTALAVAASAASNAAFAWQRSGDTTTMVIAAGVPVAANLAFEVLLHELRRQVLRRRGTPAPAAVPHPRLVRVVLAPCSTLRQWRRLVLDLTALLPTEAGSLRTGGAAMVASEYARHSVSGHASALDAGPPGHGAADAPPRATIGAPSSRWRPTTDARPTPADSASEWEPATRVPVVPARRGQADTGHSVDRAPRHHRAELAARQRVAVSDLAEQARQRYRASLTAGAPLTGRQLGRHYDRSPSWGRQRISEVKTHRRAAGGGSDPPADRRVGAEAAGAADPVGALV